MKHWMTFFAVAVLAVVLAGCSTSPSLNLATIQEAPENDAALNQKGFSGKEPQFKSATPEEVGATTETAPAGNWADDSESIVDQDFIANPRQWEEKVYFDFNRYEIKASQRPVLDKLAEYLAQNPKECVVIEGHTDQRGSDEYNRALGEKRAIASMAYLEKLGIDSERIFTISYGEDHPEVADPQGESDYRRNRRDQFLVGKKK